MLNISKVKQIIDTSFEYTFIDKDTGERTSTPIKLKVKKVSFRDSTSKQFLDAFEKINDDPSLIADVLPRLITEWDVTDMDDNGHEIPFPISKESFLDDRIDPAFIIQLSECVMKEVMPEDPRQPAS